MIPNILINLNLINLFSGLESRAFCCHCDSQRAENRHGVYSYFHVGRRRPPHLSLTQCRSRGVAPTTAYAKPYMGQRGSTHVLLLSRSQRAISRPRKTISRPIHLASSLPICFLCFVIF